MSEVWEILASQALARKRVLYYSGYIMAPIKIAAALSVGLVTLFAQSSSGTYRLDSYGIGSGGNAGSQSTTYQSTTISGQTSTAPGNTSTTYELQSGVPATHAANVPAAPNMTNPATYYNKLHIVLDTGGNPTDAKFAVAISTDSFASTQYVQSDNTVGPTLGSEDWQTYATWGSAAGVDIIGLSSNTTYYAKVKATRGLYTEAKYSAVDTAVTTGQSLTFDIDVSASDIETGPPYTTNFGGLLPGTVTDSPQRIWIDFDTNGTTGGYIFIASVNNGLHSVTTGATIASATGDLSVLGAGLGAKSMSATQSAGGPLAVQSPYNGASNNVGVLNSTLAQVYSSGAAITAGRGSLVLKAKSQTSTPAGNDYTDRLTLVAAVGF
ncbi:MAG TPA: hypothetical protein VK694_06340 [Verrucomicrobiae bacterium]|nr:hypothetical protein [Verrucomicrobiae bacterium]